MLNTIHDLREGGETNIMIVSKLPKTALRIKGSKDYVDIDGSIYTYRSNYHGRKTPTIIRKEQRLISGYLYCGVYDNKLHRCKNRRVHRIVAETFIPNPDHLPIVGHRNNIKTDNRIENLYWTTWQENSQKAVDDKLLVNDRGEADSQSKPVAMYETCTNKLIATYGSISEAVRLTGLPKTTIARQARYHRPVRKPYYFRYLDDETTVANRIIGAFDFDTDRLLSVHFNTNDAARTYGVVGKTVSQQLANGKPKHRFADVYFAYVDGECVQTTERPDAE